MKYLITYFLLISFSLSAQNVEEANKLFNSGEWARAEQAFKLHLKDNKADSSTWFRLGISQMNLGKYKEAIESLKSAKDTNYPSQFTSYNLAKAYALNDDKDNSLDVLENAVNNGLRAFKQLESDTSFTRIKKVDRFKNLVQKAKENFYPCLTDKEFRHFDFWLGEWDVYVRGNKVGENSITLANGGCAIHESYTTPSGYTGQSINYYDKKDSKWHQTWVGSSGGVLDYVEIARDQGMLQFQCEFLSPQGKIVFSRLTFSQNEDGSVRQLFENSQDGETWTPGFDGLYKRQ